MADDIWSVETELNNGAVRLAETEEGGEIEMLVPLPSPNSDTPNCLTVRHVFRDHKRFREFVDAIAARYHAGGP